MDAAGKDSAIEHVMSGVNPQGVQVVSFGKPSAEELDHDFLWRISKALPERGRIGIFNRSHYEEVVALKVHPEWLESQRLPPGERDERFWQERYEDINTFERHLARTGTKIVKFFLHVSKEVQKQRFLARLDTPGKEWKFNAADVDERGHWDAYTSAFEDALTATSTPWAPWYVIPADHKTAHPGPGRAGAGRTGAGHSTSAGPRSPRRSTPRTRGTPGARGRDGVIVAVSAGVRRRPTGSVPSASLRGVAISGVGDGWNLEADEPVQDVEDRADEVEEAVREVGGGRHAEHARDVGAARVPRHEDRGHRAGVLDRAREHLRREPASLELVPEHPGRQHVGDVLVAGDHVQPDAAAGDGER